MHEEAADVFEFVIVTCVMTCAVTKHDTPSPPRHLRQTQAQASYVAGSPVPLPLPPGPPVRLD